MTATEETADPGIDPAAGDRAGTDSPWSRTVPAWSLLLAVAAAALLGLLAVVAVSTSTTSEGADADVRLAAGRFTEEFLSFDHQDLASWRDTVLGLSTGGFAREVEDVEAGLRQLIASSQIVADTEVTDVFVGDVERGSVDAVVIYDRVVEGSDGTRTESNRYMQLTLVRVDGVWLVDSVLDIISAGGLGADSGPATRTGREPVGGGEPGPSAPSTTTESSG